jgi:hypothetical protein
MTYDPQEYDLVKRIRHIIAGVSEGIAASTASDYDRVYGHMMRTHSTPDDATSRSAYYRRRAALLFVCSQQAREALRARDRAEFGSPERLSALSDVNQRPIVFRCQRPNLSSLSG